MQFNFSCVCILGCLSACLLRDGAGDCGSVLAGGHRCKRPLHRECPLALWVIAAHGAPAPLSTPLPPLMASNHATITSNTGSCSCSMVPVQTVSISGPQCYASCTLLLTAGAFRHPIHSAIGVWPQSILQVNGREPVLDLPTLHASGKRGVVKFMTPPCPCGFPQCPV